MAEQKDDIVFEIPPELEDLDNSVEIQTKDEAVGADVKTKNAEIDIEIEDDTPPEDRGREPLPKDVVDELEKDELTDYSTRVKERMAQLKKVWHDERRVKEAAEREKEEAIRFAQQIAHENKRLKSTLSTGEVEYVNAIKAAVSQQLEMAKRDYRTAYDSGETENIIEAQQRMNDAQLRLSQVQNYTPQYNNARQEQENEVYIPQSQPQVVKPDQKALKWQKNNDWFGSDEEMTSLALGLHEKLVRSGIDPTSDEYYRRIDSTMQKRFPEYYGDESLNEDTPAQRTTKPSSVVAPATRSTAPKKVRITSTAANIAKKLGISPEAYALETLKLEKNNAR
jgi:hypothetical protein